MRTDVQGALRRSLIGGVLILMAVVGCFLALMEWYLVTHGVESSKGITVFLSVLFVTFLCFGAAIWVGNLRLESIVLPLLERNEATALMKYRAPYWCGAGGLLLGLVVVCNLYVAMGVMCLLMAVSMVVLLHWVQDMALYARSTS